MRITNLINNKGNAVKNQFVITEDNRETFQSYESKIAIIENGQVTLDPYYWDYSVTTLRHLKNFLGISDSKADIQKKIDSGEYKTADLN